MVRRRTFCAVLLAAAGSALAQVDPPIVTSPAWFTWYQSLLSQRLSDCPLARPQTFYFAQSGDDLTGDGSIQSPWKSLAKAQQVLAAAAPAGGVAILFRRGDVWRGSVGINTTTPNITIADYGDGAKPLFTTFQSVGDPAAWSPTPGFSNVFQRAAPARVMWAKQDDDLDRPWSRQRTLQGVNQTEGSWFWESGILYIHPRHTAAGIPSDPRTDGNAYEATGESGCGVRVAGDGSRVQNIRAQGWGNTVEPGTQLHGIDSRVNGGDRAAIVGCESHYGLAHVMTQSSTLGGIATFVDCKAGLTSYGTGGETMFNTYSFYGANSTIFDHCEATHGSLPTDDLPTGQRKGLGFYGHTNGDFGAQMDLTIANACTVRDTTWGCDQSANFNNLTLADTLADVRCFIVGERFEGGPGTGASWTPCSLNIARVNGTYFVHPRPSAFAAFNIAVSGWAINCTMHIDCTDQPGDFALFNGMGIWTSQVHLWNCFLDVQTRPGQVFRLDGRQPPMSVGSDVVNSVIVNTGGICTPNLSPPGRLGAVRGRIPSALKGNAYFGVDAASVALDSRALILTQAQVPVQGLSCESPLACAAGMLPGGIVLGYDQRGISGPRDDIGPVEAFVCANCDGSTVAPMLNAQDFTCFMNAFVSGSSLANCDGSTAPPVLNAADYLCFLAAYSRGCK